MALDKRIRKYTDASGALVYPGDFLQFSDGTVEKVYLLEGSDTEYELGINASREAYLEQHPEAVRECYPLSQFSSSDFHVIPTKG